MPTGQSLPTPLIFFYLDPLWITCSFVLVPLLKSPSLCPHTTILLKSLHLISHLLYLSSACFSFLLSLWSSATSSSPVFLLPSFSPLSKTAVFEACNLCWLHPPSQLQSLLLSLLHSPPQWCCHGAGWMAKTVFHGPLSSKGWDRA